MKCLILRRRTLTVLACALLAAAMFALVNAPAGRSFPSRLSTSHWMGSIPMERMDVITLLSYSP